MSQNWLKKYLTMKPEVKKIFSDLEDYREFCVEYGYVFNEAHLYNERSPWGDMQRHKKGKSVRNNWRNDSRVDLRPTQ